MKKFEFKIDNIPTVLWGESSSKVYIAVHGNMSNKQDKPIEILAQKLVSKGYQVLSFDLPQHGDRAGESEPCKVQNCVNDIKKVISYVKQTTNDISLFACSMGAYFSMASFLHMDLMPQKTLFLSPVVDMNRVINNIMSYFNIDENKLKEEQVIETSIGQTLYWDYYSYVKENPINKWDSKTSIIYGDKDEITQLEVIDKFAKEYNCNLKIIEDCEHYFHTQRQLEEYENWLDENI